MDFVDWYIGEGMDEEEWKEAYESLSISEKDLEEGRIETVEGEGDEINVHVPKINFDLLDMNYDLFHHKEVICK